MPEIHGTRPDHTPASCAAQQVKMVKYVEKGHPKVAFEPLHDGARCPICLLCMRHCIEHRQVFDGLTAELRPQPYSELRREAAALQELAATRPVNFLNDGVAVRKAA